MTTKRGVNLGCGTITMPRDDMPLQHNIIPPEVYFDTDTVWDNVDRHPAPGVTHLENLFAYPWALESNTYDVALVSHVAEHIPHDIVWNGRPWGTLNLDTMPQSVRDTAQALGGIVIPPGTHPDHQGGWYAWFSELWRIMKPGGVAYVIVPHAFTNGGVAEPTHARYCLPATFNYFNVSDDFVTPGAQRWHIDFGDLRFQPHEHGLKVAAAEMGDLPGAGTVLQAHSIRLLNSIFAFLVTMVAVKDEA